MTTNELETIVDSAREAFARAGTPADLENAKAQFTGKAGRITALMKGLATLGVDEKKARGAAINAAKQAIEGALAERRQALADAELEVQLKAEALDVSLPGRMREPGGLHPVSLTMERIEQIFASMGFDVADGPEIESDWHSFTSLNNPPNHPARSMQDTFYVDINGDDGIPYNLRPHTSPMQVRYAHAHIKKYAAREGGGTAARCRRSASSRPGRTYRVDSDATHSPMFHQCEGLWLGENVSFKDLKVVFTDFCRTFFESDDLALRFRPELLPVHRAQRRDRHPVPARSAGRALARGGRLRAGAPDGGAQHGPRSGALHRIRLRHGTGPPDHAAVWGERPAPVLRRRHSFSEAVPITLPKQRPAFPTDTPFREDMQFPESWLREFCNPPLTTEQLADTLTMGGLEVEELRPVAPPFTRIVVGEIRGGGPASAGRPAARLPGRCRAGRLAHHRVRRAERPCRHQGAMCAGGCRTAAAAKTASRSRSS